MKRPPALMGLVLLAPGCRADLPLSGPAPAREAPPSLLLTLEPPAPLDAAPPVLRLHLVAPAPIDARRLVLVRGEVRKNHLDQIADDDIGRTLAKRIVPAIVWQEDEAGEALVLAPTQPLEPGARYTVASAEPRIALSFAVAPEDGVPMLARVWPLPGAGENGRVGIFCGEDDLPPLALPSALAPGGPSGVLVTRGAAPDGVGRGCVRFEAEAGSGTSEGPWVPPPLVELPQGAGVVRLDPRPFAGGQGEAPAAVALACKRLEVPFGPGCVEVADDRLLGRAPEAPVFWSIRGAGIDSVFATGPGDPFVLTGLSPESAIALEVVTVDESAAIGRDKLEAVTLPPMPHVVLNEALANPLGAEPDQEWVELYNDGLVEATLGGMTLADATGETELPDVTLPPGGFALVVNDSFLEDNRLDVSPAEGTILVRVPRLGRGGLGNAGEPLRLLDASGEEISTMPGLPKPKAGMSLARTAPAVPSELAASFVLAAPTPGRANELVW
ncbi:lamin tail domain-containing protein [Polyangium aurulentum]|uniref:lamin tail domain-containing protein n=1 Tax=Polyangium aurulentum TaxID=2567896 RepID=UPI0010ADE8BD|nr:lamin tail domain-containing protein [Polyangium aurulentum]UQA55043.1 lamin tail domain-containing protein [Polyangium aurulentum]